MFVRDAEVPTRSTRCDPQNKLWWDRTTERAGARRTAEGADPCLLGEFTLPDGTPVKPAFQLLEERVQGLHAGMGGGHHRHSGRDHPPPRARDGHHRARPEDRAADRLDRLLGQGARDRHRQPGRLPRDARPGGALQRLPDDPRAGDPDVAARHHRPARRLPPQGAVPARDPAAAPSRRTARRRCSRTRRWTALRARLAGRARRPVRRRRRQSGAHRQGLLVGVPAVGARPDAQRHHQRLARRPVPDRHADDLHGQHGVELDHEHRRSAQDAERPRRRAASTRSRSSSSATRSSRR